MGSGGWKRAALDGNKERLVQKKGLWFVEMVIFADSEERHVQKKFFVRKKRL